MSRTSLHTINKHVTTNVKWTYGCCMNGVNDRIGKVLSFRHPNVLFTESCGNSYLRARNLVFYTQCNHLHPIRITIYLVPTVDILVPRSLKGNQEHIFGSIHSVKRIDLKTNL